DPIAVKFNFSPAQPADFFQSLTGKQQHSNDLAVGVILQRIPITLISASDRTRSRGFSSPAVCVLTTGFDATKSVAFIPQVNKAERLARVRLAVGTPLSLAISRIRCATIVLSTALTGSRCNFFAFTSRCRRTSTRLRGHNRLCWN